MTAAIPAAKAGQLVTFGIRPDRAETGYGWLELTERPSADFAPNPQPLKSFVEKPDQAKAKALLSGGMHLWNAGIFLFTATAILDAFEAHEPAVLTACRTAIESSEQDLSFTRLNATAWDKLPNISIDYAVMERASNLTVVP